MDRKVLITGTGIHSALGKNTEEVALNLHRGNAACVITNSGKTISRTYAVSYKAGQKITKKV